MTTDLIGGIGALLVDYAFGNILLAALFLYTFMIVLGLVMRFTLDCWVVNMTSLSYVLLFHPETRLLPEWMWIIVAMILGIIIGFGVIRFMRKQ